MASIGALSTGGLTQYVQASSNLSRSQQAWQALQRNLALGNLNGAQAAFNSYQQATQNLAVIGGNTSSSSSQVSTDMTALGSALSSGNLSTAQLAFKTAQTDMSKTQSQGMANAIAATSQAVQWIDDLLDLPNSSSSSSLPVNDTNLLNNAVLPNSAAASADPATAALSSAHIGNNTAVGNAGLNVYA
jgi:hypothetical protein